jgi:arylsulfatase A-like enzyme
MNRRQFILSASSGAIAAAMPTSGLSAATQPSRPPQSRGPASPDRPNIIVLITDQNRAGLSKRSGYPLDVTPAMDRLAATGVDFRHAYVTLPACVPSRTSMLTGRWPSAHRVRMNLAPQDAFFAKDMYQVAREQGYRTGLIGKNHTYLEKSDLDYWQPYFHEGGTVSKNAHPQSAEFDKWLKTLDYNHAEEPAPFPVETQLPYRIISDTIDFVRANGAQPFLLQVSIPEPHDPEQVPHPYWDMFPPDSLPDRCAGPEALAKLGPRARWLYELQQTAFPNTEKHWRRYVSNYLGALRLIDDQVARLASFLEETGQRDNTIIVRLSDHGDYLMDYGLGRKGVGLPEALTHVPMFWTGPGVKPSPEIGASAFVSVADIMPTLCEIMGAEIPVGVQGRSLWPLLKGEPYPADEFRSIMTEVGLGGLYYEEGQKPVTVAIKPGTTAWDELNGVTQSGNAKMVRMGEWKLIYDMMGYGQLYHLPSDPCELNNRFGQPDVAREQAALMAELAMWTIRTQDSLPTGPQNDKYQTKWARPHNWYAPYRHGTAPVAFIP